MPEIPEPLGNTRETFRTQTGAVLAMAGTAIGLGNIWRFPYMMGLFGGASFLAAYLACVLGLGVPALMCEWALGRATGRGPMGAFERAGVPGGRFWGGLFSFAIFMAASYYVVVIGWVARTGIVVAEGTRVGSLAPEFPTLVSSFGMQVANVWPCILAACAVLYLGVRRGIERISRVATPLILLLFLVLAARSLALDGAWGATLGYFADAGQFGPRTVLAALGQSIFSLALGGTTMVVYGSYLRREDSIGRGAAATAALDTACSVLVTMAIVPAALAFGTDMASGPTLLFEVVPDLFGRMPAGRALGVVFLVAVWLAAMLSLIAAYEVIVAGIQDAWSWPRPRALLLLLGTQCVLTFPAMWSVDYILWSDLVWGSTMQPLGAAASVVALVWFLGRSRAIEALRGRADAPFPCWLFYWIKYAVPAGILSGLTYGWLGS